jgi:hypothetical protein
MICFAGEGAHTDRGGVLASPPARTRDDMQLPREHAFTSKLLKTLPRRMAASALVVLLAVLVASWLARSAWILLVAPITFVVVFDLARIRVEGPTVDGIDLSGLYGVIALVRGRGIDALLMLLPLIVGCGWGAVLSRRSRGPARSGRTRDTGTGMVRPARRPQQELHQVRRLRAHTTLRRTRTLRETHVRHPHSNQGPVTSKDAQPQQDRQQQIFIPGFHHSMQIFLPLPLQAAQPAARPKPAGGPSGAQSFLPVFLIVLNLIGSRPS